MKSITDIAIVPRQPRWPVRLDPGAPPSLRKVARDTSSPTTEQTMEPITDMEQSASSKAYHAAVRPLTDDEYALLKEDIAKRGIISPIIKDAAGNIVDGYHRNKIAEELGLTDIPIKQVDGTEAELQAMAIALNVARRRFRGSRHDAMPRMKTKAMYSVAKIKGLALAGALLSAGVTQAKTVTVMGAGVQTCGTWLEHVAKDYRDYRVTDTQWVIGYLAGVNDETPNFGDLLDGIDNGGVAGWLDQYCLGHPLDTLHNAARALVDDRAHSVPKQ